MGGKRVRTNGKEENKKEERNWINRKKKRNKKEGKLRIEKKKKQNRKKRTE